MIGGMRRIGPFPLILFWELREQLQVGCLQLRPMGFRFTMSRRGYANDNRDSSYQNQRKSHRRLTCSVGLSPRVLWCRVGSSPHYEFWTAPRASEKLTTYSG